MGITHSFVSTKSDGADNSLVKPSDWNSGHAIVPSYTGYNTIGASWETMGTRQQFCKSITLSSNSLVLSIDAYMRPSTDQTAGLIVTLLTDNGGEPHMLIAAGGVFSAYLSNSSSMPGTARWVAFPLNAYVSAGTYWICIMPELNRYDLAYDSSGSDKYFTSSVFLATGTYPSAWSITTTARKYSIRAAIL